MSSSFKQAFSKATTIVLNQFGKLGEQRHMAALRDGFALLVPLIVAASIGVICMTFVFGWWDTTSTSLLGWISWGIPGQVHTVNGVVKFVDGSVAKEISTYGTFIFYTIWKGIFSFLSVFAALTISYSLARIKNIKDTFIAPLIGLGAFLTSTYGDITLFGSDGLLIAIITSIIAIEFYAFFEKNEKLQLKMPQGVPPAVGRAFSKLFPSMFTLLIIVGINAPFILFSALGTGMSPGEWMSFGHAIQKGIQSPFMEIASNNVGSYVIGFVYIVFGAVLWFFGLHGQNILMGIFSPIMIAGLQKNLEYLEGNNPNITGPTVLADGVQDAFIFFGGTGATLALVLVGLFLSKKKAEREIIKFGALPAFFNINEPIVFGVPLILNFVYVIPFIGIQIVLFTTTWLVIEKLQWVPPVIVKIPWTTPIGIGGFLATSSWQGIVLALFNFILAILIWLPFVLIANKIAKRKGEELVKIDYKGGIRKFSQKFNKSFKTPIDYDGNGVNENLDTNSNNNLTSEKEQESQNVK